MRKYLIISLSLLLFLSVGFTQTKEYNIDDLLEKDGLISEKFNDKILNGDVYQMFGDKKVPLGKMKDGKKEGKWIGWYKNGQKLSEGIYKDGKRDGLWTDWNKSGWYESGQKNYEGTYKDGKEDGLVTWWYVDGQKESEGTYKDGKPDGLHTEWERNGQKKIETRYKDGIGFRVVYYESGKKREQGNIKEGKRDGLWKSYDRNNDGYYEMVYKSGHGRWDGIYGEWWENGEISYYVEFKKGVKIRDEKYNMDGSVRKQNY